MTLRAFLTLIRPPNVFTAVADSLAGLVVLWALGVSVPDRACAIVLSSACLYLAGIVLNDVFDRGLDAVERPTRPIPSGAVGVGEAALLGAGLMIAGLVIAAWVGRDSLSIAMALSGCILLYDGGLKRTRLGPLVMGSCRGLDVAMGLATGLPLAGHWPTIAIAGPIVLALYVAGLTYIARDEVDGNTARRARTGLLWLAALAAAVLIGLLACARPASPWAWPWVGLLLLLGWRNWGPLWRRHDGPTTGRAIGGGILLIPLIDATFCAVAGCPFWALPVALLAVPALLLKQLYSPT
jgi:4-hydroxybenzoate polyprenyltransferase